MNHSIHDLTACIRGAISIEPGTTGVAIHRTTPRTRGQIADPAFDFISGVPSGVRIETVTTAQWIEIDLSLTRIGVVGEQLHQISLDVVVDGELQQPIPITATDVVRLDPFDGTMSIEPGGPQTLRCPLGTPPAERRVEIWLPHAARTEILAARTNDDAILTPTPDEQATWLHHGSSISQCSEVGRPTHTWPALVARRAGRSLTNLGLGGQCHLDQGIARTIRDAGADAISMEIGINIVGGDTMHDRTFSSAFHGFLDTIREGAPDTPILVISPIVCPGIEDRPGPLVRRPDGLFHSVQRPQEMLLGALSLSRARQLLENAVEMRVQEGDDRLRLINGLDLFGTDDADDLPDALHPNKEGYGRMAERFYPMAFGKAGFFGT